MYWPGFYQQNYDYESPGTTGSIFLVLEVFDPLLKYTVFYIIQKSLKTSYTN